MELQKSIGEDTVELPIGRRRRLPWVSGFPVPWETKPDFWQKKSAHFTFGFFSSCSTLIRPADGAGSRICRVIIFGCRKGEVSRNLTPGCGIKEYFYFELLMESYLN
jgi:hypothetical protein